MRKQIFRIDAETRDDIRRAVCNAIELYPNAHLGECSPREDMRSAFRMIRSHAMHNGCLRTGISVLARDTDRYRDM